MLRKLIKTPLHGEGFTRTIEASDGKQVIDLLMEHKVDLIISGMDMPKVNGLELVKALKNHSSLKVIPFMVLTSDTDNEMFQEIMQSGAIDYLLKPFTNQELVEKVKTIAT